MSGRWFVISKVKLRETVYASWLASNVASAEAVVYEDGNSRIKEIVEERRKQRDIRKENVTVAGFFAAELADMRIGDKKNALLLRYDKKSSSVEFARIITADSIYQVIDNATALVSIANLRKDEEKDTCIVSEGDVNNIACMIEIGCGSVRFIAGGDIAESLPEDMWELYETAVKAYSAGNRPYEHIDSEIVSKFTAITGKRLENERKNIVLAATPEKPVILTKDAFYITDGKNVSDMCGSVIKGADPFTFESLGNRYAKDARSVYYGTEAIEGACLHTFTAMPWEYAADHKRGYFKGVPICGGNKFRALRPAYGYATDGKCVYYLGTPIEGCDPKTFYAIGDGRENGKAYFGTDGKSVYLDGKQISRIDAKTFEHIENRFFKDKNHVYCGAEIIEECSPDGVKVLNDCYVSDQRKVFFIGNGSAAALPEADPAKIKVKGSFAADGKRAYYKDSIIKEADGSTAKIYEKNNDGYIKDAHSVFYCNKKLPASPDTFEPLGFGYAKDESKIFFRDKLVKNADSTSFRPTGFGRAADRFAKYRFEKQYPKKNARNTVHITGDYYKDEKNVYYRGTAINGADPDTFSPVFRESPDGSQAEENVRDSVVYPDKGNAAPAYAKDAKKVYFNGIPIEGADPSSFILLDKEEILFEPGGNADFYGKDAAGVYFKGEKIQRADPATFRPHKIKSVWEDKNYLFTNGEVIPHIDIQSFKHIEYSFYKDINGVYCETETIKGISPENLTVLNPAYIKDDTIFCYVEKTGDGFIANLFKADPNSFDIVDSEPAFSFDKDGMFFRGLSICGIDMATAELIGGEYIKDKNSVFCGNVKMSEADAGNFTFLGDGYAFDGKTCYYRDIVLDTKQTVYILGAGYATDGNTFWHKGKTILDPKNNKYIADALGMIF